jgi:hypothetical protein
LGSAAALAAAAPAEVFEALVAMPSVSGGGKSVSSANKSFRSVCQTKQATIRQHYYPEGGWGYVVVLVTFLVQVIAHGFHMSLGVLLTVLVRRWGEDTLEESGKKKERSTLVLGTNPNPTESGSGSFSLRIRSTKGSESSSPDPDPGAEASFPKLTNILGEFSCIFFCLRYITFLCVLQHDRNSYNPDRPFPFPNLHE